MPATPPGIAFEKVVAAIQTQIDPAATVAHNEIIPDRLGQSRQFDVVVRGVFAGQQMLGIIECKDLGRKVGTPEVDGFVTKAQDVNANFKILMSRRGFSKPALVKCAHYGIQALSLVENDPANKKFFIGARWEADITRWGQISVSLHFANEPSTPVHFNAEDLTIRGKKVLDWFQTTCSTMNPKLKSLAG
ncbi:MAG: restriction endonuclease [Pseudomonadota bacterium]